MEVVLLVGALAFAGLMLGRMFSASPLEVAAPLTARPTRDLRLAATLDRQLPVRLFAPTSAELLSGPPPREAGTGYALALASDQHGRWVSTLRAEGEVDTDGHLTITLVIPWNELARRYAAVNLVVR